MSSMKINRSIRIALIVMFAALYAALTVVFAPISYLNLQIRISEILIAFIPFYGVPALLGLTLGTLLANTISPLGLIDLLVGPVATFLGGVPLLYLRRLGRWGIIVGFFMYAFIVSILVALELAFVLALPFEIMFIEVFLGEVIAAGVGSTIVFGVLQLTTLPLAEPLDEVAS